MKPVRRADSMSQSCSCTSCLYKSESEQPSIRKYVAHGSRIDRLYFGKYIPLRERKLLNRLVRTRAVYDDLRARLISDSTLSLEKNADLRPGKHHRVITPLDSEKSGAILELVDIIDKGAALGPKKLSDCCSCCSCSSKSKILELDKKEQRGKRVYARTYEEKYGVTGQTGTGTGEGVYLRKKYGKTGQTGTGEGVYETYEREFKKTVPGRMGERYNKRGVSFKAKHIRSDPCTCTFKFSGLIKKHSKAMFRKVRPPPLEEPFIDAEEQYVVENSKKKKFSRKSFQKYKDLRDKLEQDIRKLNESKANIKQNLQVRAKKSLEQVKQVKNKMKRNIESGVRKSIQAVKALHPKETLEPVEYPDVETTFKIKKDSIVKFKDYLKRKEMMKDWECDLECEPDVCVPEECFRIIKLRRSLKRNRQRDRKHGAGYELIKREVKIGGAPLSRSNSGVQTEQFAITAATRIKKHKPMLRVDSKNQVMEKRLIFQSERVHKVGGKKGVNKKVKTDESVTPTHEERAFRDIKNKAHIETKNEILKGKGLVVNKPRSHSRQAVRIKSSFSFDLEFYKNRPDAKLLRSSQPGIHMHAPRRKRRKIHRHHGSNVLSKSSLESSQGTPEHFKARLIQTDKYGRAPITSQGQLVSKISQCECEKRLSNVKTNTNYGAKSVASTTNNVATVDKNVSKEVNQKGRLSQVSLSPPTRLDNFKLGKNESKSHYKQAVRIGSTFSFNVEFYKNDKRDVSETPKSSIPQKPPELITEKVIHTRSKHGQVKRKLVQVKGTSAKAYNQAKTTLHRCFCTLKVNNQVKTKKGPKQKAPLPAMIDKYVETNKNNRFEPPKLKYLLPYECEPDICIPDECDPILCKKILDLRKQRFRRRISRSIGSYTGSRKTKSTSSIVSRPFSAARAKIVQSSIVSTKDGSTGAPRRYKNNFNLGRQELIKRTVLGRQAVRVGSSFSFNIEFYKDTKSPAMGIAYKPSLSSMPPEVNYKEQKFIEQKKRDNKRNKAMFTKVTKIEKYIGPSLKNCLCTLKLYKNKVPKMKTLTKATKLTAITQTFGDAPIRESVDRGTRTKREHRYKLLPYECEPYTCVPGECDPYICLQNIKRRELNTRDMSVFTDRPDIRSMSSLTENSLTKSQAILVQPKLFRRGTNMKANYFETLDRSRPTRETFYKASKSKQAVRIGSSFNFTIEFSKQLPGPVTLAKYPKIKHSTNVYPKMNRDKGITVTKVRVNHGDTQAQEPRKINRASLVRPMLKRCFCTLNLQKKTKQQYGKGKQENKYFGPQVYTVGRATTTKTKIITHSFGSQVNANLQLTEPKAKIISVSTRSFLLHNYAKSLKSKYETVKLYSSFRIPIQSKEPVVIKSNLSMKLGTVRQVLPSKESKIRYIKQPSKSFNHAGIDDLKLFNLRPDSRFRTITGISRYLERCFCTMNVQIANPEAIPSLKKISHKLKPYECEPGICIPGECDPYECKKNIMKRFTKNVHVSSGTKSKSISSYVTSNPELDSLSTQMQTRFRNHSQVTVPQRYKIQRQREAKQRQAVRLKSSFSFDLEFYKHRSRPFEKYINRDATITNIKIPVNHKSIESVSKSTQENKIDRKGTKLQTTVVSLHKSTGSMAKRCFCTLKLQKKGRIHKQYEKLNSIPVKQLPSTTSRNVKIGTTNKYHKIPVDLSNLKFYECEPGICIPGQCDPYKCLELMKNRRNLGTNTIRKEKISVPSMTSKEKFRTRVVDAVPVITHHKGTKTIKYSNLQNDSDITHISDRTVRPAVRIGSSFSFNIEFYKDMPQKLKYADTNLQKKKTSKKAPRQIQDKKELKAITSQTKAKKELKVSRAIVTEKPLNEAATVTTSFTNRCFCTAKLRSTKVAENRNKKTFMHKCFCLLGLRGKENKEYQTTLKIDNQSKEKEKYQPAIKTDLQAKGDINNHLQIQPVTAEKPTNTNVKYKVYSPYYLEPYECEPGICIPGKCDPYLCEQIIQQRFAKQHSKKSETETIRTHSASSSFKNYKQLKNERTQVQGQTNIKQIKHFTKDIPSSMKKKLNADKRLTRIGSNFSFNIEFYKENVNGSVIKEKTSEKKSYPNTEVVNVRIPTKNVSKSIGTETVTEHRDKTQIKTKTSGVSPLLKRCFCTLKLLNKPTKQIDRTKTVNQLDTKSIKTTRTVETQSHKRTKSPILQPDIRRENLSPYECEPFVCIPGHCDPVECFDRIKRRQQQTKEISTTTKYPKRKTIGSVTTRMKDENLQVKHLTPANKSIQKTSFVKKYWPEKSYHQPRQAVRIGSNFSFNIEFFKDSGDDIPKVVTNSSLEELNIEKYSKNIKRQHTKTQPTNFNRNKDLQVITKKLQSTETATGHLKQCFCTLPLRDKNLRKEENTSIKIKSVQPKSDHSSIGHFLKKCICTLKLNKVGKQQNQPPAPAVKYEIKGTSTRSRRTPQVNIVKPVRLLEPYECEPYICVPGKCDPYECLKRIQRRELRDFGTDYKRNVKDSATDSIKQPLTRSTKAQYHLKRKFNTRGTSSVSKRTRRSREISQFLYDKSHNTNRQVVRIGSNFSFNVEFFKDRGIPNTELKELNAATAQKLKPVKLQLERPEKLSTKSGGTISVAKRLRNKKSQCSYPRRHVLLPSANIAPKRCFCSLKLLKQPNHRKSEVKLISPMIPTKDKATATKIKHTIPQELGVYECPPLMCIPGECNPYECLEKIKKREIMRKSRNVGTRAPRKSIAYVGNGPSNVRAHKVQSQIIKRRHVIACTPHSEQQSELLKSSRIIENSDRRNKCAVRIGSNFNFNVEFFKQKLQPDVSPVSKIVKDRSNEEESYFNNKITAGARNFGHSYTNKTQLKNQASNAENSLKRCFCTLQLQKPTNRKITGVKMNRPGNNLRYPQTFTVGRVSVEPCPNTVAKIIQTKKVDKARSTSIDSKLLKRTVGTRTNRKYLNFSSSQCNPNNCPDYQKNVLSRKTENDMQTILPFTPSKFNKESKTFVSTKNKIRKNRITLQLKEEDVYNPSDTSIVSKGRRRLTAKKSKKSIPTNSVMETKSFCRDSFFCRCVKFFFRRAETRSEGSDKRENINNINKKINQSRTIPPKMKLTIPPKKAKSIGDNCPIIFPKDTNDTCKTFSILQGGDVNNNIVKAFKRPKIGGGKNVTFADNSKYPNNKMFRRKTNKSVHSESIARSRLCYSCSANNCPLNKGDHHTSGNSEIREKSTKSYKKAPSYSESVDDCQYCECCKRKIDTDEISKGGGDRRLTISSKYKEDAESCPCGKELIIKGKERTYSLSNKSRADNLGKKYSTKADKCCSKIKPILEMRLDSDSHDIINKSEVKKKLELFYSNSKPIDYTKSGPSKSKLIDYTKSLPSKSKHRNNCICCKCVKKRELQEATTTVQPKGATTVEAKGTKDGLGKFGNFFQSKNITLTNRPKPPKKNLGPCVCGSKKCAIESKRKRRDEVQKDKVKFHKTCVCGTNICTIESRKIKRKKERAINKAKKKSQSVRDRKEMEAVNRRVKIQEEKDEIHRLKRIKRNKELERKVKQYKNAGDFMLAVDSLADIGRLGFSTLGGALRYTTKAVVDPKVACERLCKKCRKKDPESFLKQLQTDYMESDAASTMRRLKMRCLFMKRIQSLKEKLEGNPITHFILHIADKNAKTRKFKRKPVRRIREPVDFQCSLYMATLRKRPYLSVYYKWPSFYPHFMTMLNIWRQFTDIMLFLLAAVVWSPCILCMEGCRALMCCFFCTG